MYVQPDITIETDNDWSKFKNPENSLDTIIDPMVYRSADLFLRGVQGAKDLLPDKKSDLIWQAISLNIGSLAAFFDAVILNDHLPLIDYGITFDSNIGFDQGNLYDRCNYISQEINKRPLLRYVHVMGEASAHARKVVLFALKERPKAPPELETSILQELSAYDYAWHVNIPDLEVSSEHDEKILRFLYGGLLFGEFAHASGADHLMQPKRSRLYIAMTLNAPHSYYVTEQELFEELKSIASKTPGMEKGMFEMDHLPTFLFYLLSKRPGSPNEMLRMAFELKDTPEVIEYRKWRKELLQEWENGVVNPEKAKEIFMLSEKVRRMYRVSEEATLNLGFSITPPLYLPSLEVGKDNVPVGRIWGWVLQQLPGKHYRKIFMRMAMSEEIFRKKDRMLRLLWLKPN